MSIEVIVLDVDGTLTNGSVCYNTKGEEMKCFSVKDGLGLASWIKMGKEAIVVTGRSSPIVEQRIKELGIKHIYQGIKDKKSLLEKLLKEMGYDFSNCAVIGDDMNDYGMLKASNISFAPCDANKRVLDMVTVKLSQRGGEGAVREMIDYLLVKEGLEEEFDRLWDAI